MHRISSFGAFATMFLLGSLHMSAQQPAREFPAPRTSAGAAPSRPLLAGTRTHAFSTIQGNALTSTNGQLPDSLVRLRDARTGRIVDMQMTDKAGLFAFKTVDPGTYVVELVGNDQTVLAASQLLDVNAGEALSAVVKLPWRAPPLAGILGRTVPSAVVISAAAAASGVLAATVTGTATCELPAAR
jgi:hypothetical protein